MSDNGGDFYSFLGGLLFGAVAGAAAGMLLAPKSGVETRRDLKEKAEEVYDRGREMYAEQRDRLDEAIESGKEALTSKTEELKSKLEEGAAVLRKSETKPATGGGKASK